MLEEPNLIILQDKWFLFLWFHSFKAFLWRVHPFFLKVRILCPLSDLLSWFKELWRDKFWIQTWIIRLNYVVLKVAVFYLKRHILQSLNLCKILDRLLGLFFDQLLISFWSNLLNSKCFFSCALNIRYGLILWMLKNT